jgi:hypothetical protein
MPAASYTAKRVTRHFDDEDILSVASMHAQKPKLCDNDGAV